MTTPAQLNTQQILASLQDERDGVTLYTALAKVEKNPQLAEVYRRLAAVEQRHAERWAAQLAAAGVSVPMYSPGWRTKTLVWLAQRFGVAFVLPSITAREQADAGKYQGVPGAADMSGDEISHARLLSEVTRSLPGGLEGAAIAQAEGRHRAGGGNALRAAVLGANDGLLSNMSLVMGVAGGGMDSKAILMTGVAGLLAGACSMALGEWLSVQSSRELYQKQIAIEQSEIEAHPEEEAEELALIYESRGVEPRQARALAERIMADRSGALDALSREELGIDPEELGGSAWEAAITSFLLFSVGAVIPVAPFLFLSETPAVVLSLVLCIIALFGIGAGITLFTGRSVLFSGMRQVGFGLAAAAITYSVGRLIGVTIAG